MNTQGTHLNRRRFLLGASAAAGTAILAACGSDATVPTATTGATAGATSAGGATMVMGAPTTPPTYSSAPVLANATAGMPTVAAAPAATVAAAASSAPAASGTSAAAPAAGASTPTASMTGAMAGPVKSQIDPSKIKKGGTLIEGSTTDVRTFNPVLSSDVYSSLICGLVYSSLVDIDPDTVQPVPSLATKWDISPDGKTYTFTLKPGIKWHDGQPFTADDVKFSYDAYMNGDTGTPRAGILNQRIASVDVKDPLTVVFTLKDVIAPFITTNMYPIIAKHLFQSVPAKEYRTAAPSQSPVGTGPFRFKSYKQADNVTLVANPDFHLGAPALDTYIYKFVKDSTVLLQQLKTGEVDFAVVTPDNFDEAKKQTNFNTITYDTFSFTYYGYNLDRPVLQDAKVRQALLYALDRKTMVQKIKYGLSTVAVGTMPVASWAYQPDKITMKYDYDPMKAMQLLDDAGWKPGADGIRVKDGKKLSFDLWTYSGQKVNDQYVQVMQESWKAIGVDMRPNQEEFSIFMDRITKSFDFDVCLLGFSWGVDPDQTTMFDSTQHLTGFNSFDYKSDKVDALLAQGLHTLDQDKRKAIYVDMQNALLADLPNVVMDFGKGITGVNKRVGNRIPNGVAGSDRNNAHQWYVSDGK